MLFPELNHLNHDPQSLENISSRKKKNIHELPLTPEENDLLLQILDEAKAAEKVENFSLATAKYQEYKEVFFALRKEKFISELSEKYTFKNPKTKKETTETVTLNIEKKLEEFISFYERNNITLPKNFGESMKEIWQRNQEEIREAMREKGFDDLLLIPGNLSLPELHTKMTADYENTWESDNFKKSGSFAKAKSEDTDHPRLVLLHNTKELTDRSELIEALGIKGEDVSLEKTLTLEDYLVFQKKYFEETGKHLDEVKYTWLTTKLDTRLVSIHWYSGEDKLGVDVHGLEYQTQNNGCRLSRSFF